MHRIWIQKSPNYPGIKKLTVRSFQMAAFPIFTTILCRIHKLELSNNIAFRGVLLLWMQSTERYHTNSWHQNPKSPKNFRKIPTVLIFLDIWTHFSLKSVVLYLPGKLFQKFCTYGVGFHWRINLFENSCQLLVFRNIPGWCSFFFSWHSLSVFSQITGVISSINHPIENFSFIEQYSVGKSVTLFLV